MVLLEKNGTVLDGAKAVVLGRSNIVGMPVSLLLLRENATVTICHSHTKDIPATVREADVIVAAIGKPGYVRGDWIKPGATVIDVGTNRWMTHPPSAVTGWLAMSISTRLWKWPGQSLPRPAALDR